MADTSQQALADIQSFNASAQNPNDVLTAAQNKYGTDQSRQRLVGLRSAIMGTEGALNAVDPSVTGRTSNSLVTEAQRSRMVANERAPIAEQYSQQQGALANENANLSDLSARAAQEAQATLTGQDSKRSALQSLYDTLYKREQDAIAQQKAEQARQDALAAQRAQDSQNAQYAALLKQIENSNKAAASRPSLDSLYGNGSGGLANISMGTPINRNKPAPTAAQIAANKSNNRKNLATVAGMLNPATMLPATLYAGYRAAPSITSATKKAVGGVKGFLGKYF